MLWKIIIMKPMKTLNKILCDKAIELLNLDVGGIFIADRLTNIVDDHLISAFEAVIPKDCFIALLAIGGYGRKENTRITSTFVQYNGCARI